MENITNEMLYNLIQEVKIDLKSDIRDLKTDLKRELDILRTDERETKERVQFLYDNRDHVTIDFSRRLLLGHSFLAALVSFIVAMFTGKMVINN